MRYVYGSTNTAAALYALRTQVFAPGNGNRPSVQDIVIVIVDGTSNVNGSLTIPEARLVKNSGATIAGIGVGLGDRRELEEIVSHPASRFAKYVASFDHLEDIAPLFVHGLCRGIQGLASCAKFIPIQQLRFECGLYL